MPDVTKRYYWQARMVKDGPYIGIVSWFGPPVIDGEEQDRSPRWQCLVRNETTSRAILFGDNCPIEVDGVTLRNIEGIPQSHYAYLVAHSDWSTKHAPHLPDAAPTTKIEKRGKSVW